MSRVTTARFNKTLSYLFSMAMTVLLAVFVICIVFAFTFGDVSYMTKSFRKGGTITTLTQSLEKNYCELSDKTDIPAQVFLEATDENLVRSVQQTVVISMQSSNKIDFRSTTYIEQRLEDSINKYDEENGITRSDSDREELVNDAINIFNEACSIANNAELSTLSSLVNNRLIRFAIIIALAIALCFVAELFFNHGRHKGFNYIAMALVASGEMLVSLGAIVLLSGTLRKLTPTNIEAYNNAILSVGQNVFMIIICAGLLLAVIGFSLFYFVFKYYKAKLIEMDTENEIARNLIKHNYNDEQQQ